MWPFKCKNCKELEKTLKQARDLAAMRTDELIELEKLSQLCWYPLKDLFKESRPIATNLLVANKDKTYFGFLYMEDGWDQSKKINMQSKDKIWPCYTNPESISWWLNLDLIGNNER